MANQVLNGVVGRMTAMLAVSEAADRSDSDLLRGFISRSDAGAFEAIVRRHGPMVLGVCRRLLRNAADAEDAFQATFIVLVRRARSLRRPERLAGWLYQVAYRVARKARQRLAQRINQTLSVDVPVDDPVPQIVWNELRPIFDDELNRLPEKLRLPVVLCFLEGLTKREAARRLEWPEGTVSSRLQTAREALRIRLGARGLALSVSVFHIALFQGTAPAAIPATLLSATIQSTTATAAASTSAAAFLAEGVVQSMFVTKIKMLAASVLAVGLLGGGAGWMIGERGSENVAFAQSGSGETEAKKSVDSKPNTAAVLLKYISMGSDKGISDEEFLRRVFLDLTGTLPTVEQVRDFKKETASDKHAKLIDRLLENHSFDAWRKRFRDIAAPEATTRIAEYEKAYRAQTALEEWFRGWNVQNNVDKEMVRRVWLDVFGLPPSELEVHGFLNDQGYAKAFQQFAQRMRDANVANQQAEIEAARIRLKALEKQLADEQARNKEREQRQRYLQALQQAQAAWEAELKGLQKDRLLEQELAARIKQLDTDIEMWKERVAWAERMVLKGYLTRTQAAADKAKLASIQEELDRLIRQQQAALAEKLVRDREAAVKKETDAIAKGTGSEAARDRALADLTEAKIKLARAQIKEELLNLVALRQREVDRIAKAVEQKLLPAADLDKARAALEEAKKRLAESAR